MIDENKIRHDYSLLTRKLIAENKTITTMESCTAGLIASLITDTEGSSRIFKGAYISYSNEIKIKLGVSESVIEKYSVYSEETAQAMAETCRNAFSADYGIGITGTTGNIDPENSKASEPGKIYFAFASAQKTTSYTIEIKEKLERFEYKFKAAEKILEKLSGLI